jgi:predicted Rossmann-fold nucleotide-binding protein
MRKPVIGVMGGGDEASPESVEWARELGRQIARRGWVTLSGGRPVGVMGTVCEGAHVKAV